MTRGRKADIVGIQSAILPVLVEYPEGLPINQLAKLSRLPPMTLRFHLERSMLALVEINDVNLGRRERPYLRIVRLKPGALTKASLLLQRVLSEHQ
jgi:hypothetical protein